MLDTMIFLTGPNGHTRFVAIKTYPSPDGRRQSGFRLYLSRGWKEFVKENGFQTGDCVIFRLEGNSCFHVLVSSELQEKAVLKTLPLSCELSKCDKLSTTNLGVRDHHLELPICFAKEHGHKFQAPVVLLGPYGRWRIVKLRVSSIVRTSIRVQFRQGWKVSSLENGFNEGDVLLFSLVGLSKFVVQVFPEAKR